MGNEIELNKVFVVYFDGKPIQARGRKAVYKAIGSAKLVITEEAKTLAYEVMRKKYGSDYYTHREELDAEIENQRKRFDIRNYMPLGVRQEVAWFGAEMEKQLAANDHKGGWKNEDEGYFLYQIDLIIDKFHRQTLSTEEKIKLTADIANYAMMIADNSKEVKNA